MAKVLALQAQLDQRDNMNFNEIYKKIAQIDGVLTESKTPVQECGDMPPAPGQAPHSPMSLTVNLNAQGEDDISSLMRLLTKVNPDMMPQGDTPLPGIKSGPELSIGGPGVKVSSPADDIKGDMMKLLPLDEPKDMDGEEDGEEDHDDDEGYDPERMKDGDMMPGGAGAGDISKDDEKEDEAYANDVDTHIGDTDDMTHDGNDLNKAKGTFPKVNGGDNPMQRVKEELMARLAELKSK